MAHWYQMNNEVESKLLFDSLANQTKNCLPRTRLRDEYDISGNGAEYFKPQWHKYTTALNSLHFGVDMWNIFSNDLQDADNYEAFSFYSKYVGVKEAACSSGGFVALRDGLDANDFVRFPAATYGNGTQLGSDNAGKQRCVAIANAFSAFGAKQLDPVNGQGGSFNQVTSQNLNDVGWRIHTGNYERYITQWKPNETSVGYWQQGDTTQVYGRFARGFNHATNKDTLFFNVADNLLVDFPNNGKTKLKIRVVYLNKGIGTWQLRYDAVGNAQKIGLNISKTNTNRWIDTTITVTDAYFGNRCPNGTDLMLVNTDANDDIFHLIEVQKLERTTETRETLKEGKGVQVFPNPVDNQLSISFGLDKNTAVKVSLFDLTGREIAVLLNVERLNGQQLLNLPLVNLQMGCYFLKIDMGEQVVVKKIFKM